MFSSKDTIHFSCKQCGKCCYKSPNMHLYDMLELSDEFIFQTSHNVIASYATTPLEKDFLKHYQSIGHTIMMPELDASLFYFVDFTTVVYPSYEGCSKLIDNQCSIYGKRPSNCRISPLDVKLEDSNQWRSLSFFKENTIDHDWQCDFSEEAPIVFKNEQIEQTNHNSIYFNSVDHIRDFTDKYIDFLNLGNNNQKHEHFKALFQAVIKKQTIITDMIIPLKVACYNNIITNEFANTFINNQINLIDKEINYSISNKRKDNLNMTRLYKKQKEDYIRAIKENIFYIN